MGKEDERRRRWSAHCHRMAEATYALADWCEDAEMLAAYLDLAARWIRMAEEPPRRAGVT
jgi:hypothetical protein